MAYVYIRLKTLYFIVSFGLLAACAGPVPLMSPYEPQHAVEICAGGACGKLGQRFALNDVAKALAEMFQANGPGVWDFCQADRLTRRCINNELTYTINGMFSGHVPQGALRAGAQYDGERQVKFRVNVPTLSMGMVSGCDDARSILSVRSAKNVLWLSTPYLCSMGGGPKNINAEGRLGIDFIDFDRGILGGEFSIRVTGGGSGYTTGYALTKLSVGMQDSQQAWLQPKGDTSLPTSNQSIQFTQQVSARPDDVAVIIGNADYSKGRDIPNVNPAYADAAGIKNYIKQSLGIGDENIIFLKDATQAQLIATFGSATNPKGQLFNYVKPGKSRVFVYYSGHGAPGGTDGGSYIVPADAQASLIDLNGYPLNLLYKNLGKIPAKSVTIVVEACFSGMSQSGTVTHNASPLYLKAKETAIPSSITVIAAGAANQIASWDQDKSSSLFTKYFLKGMSGDADATPYGNGDGKVGYDELDRYLKETLTYYARRYYGRDQTAQIVIRTDD